MKNLPPGWITTSLDSVVDILDAQRIPVNRAERLKRHGSVPYYGATGQVGWINKPIFDEELLLVGEDGVPFLDPKKAKSYIVQGPSWVNNHAHVLRSLSGITSNRYLMHYLNRFDYRDYVNGTTRLKLTQGSLRTIPIELPSLTEQERIVERIEEIFTRLNAIETTLMSVLEKLKYLCSTILVSTFYADRDLPPYWMSTTVGEVAEVQLGRQRSPKHHIGRQMRPYLRAANVTWDGVSLDDIREMNFNDSDFERYRLEPGDLLLNEASGTPGEVGKPAIWDGEIEDCCFQNTLLRLRPRGLDLGYLYWYCYFSALTGRFGDAGRGVNIRHLGKRGLSRFPIPVAPRSEQSRIADDISNQFDQIRSLQQSVEDAQNRMAMLRRAVLAEAFAGRLVPQDPDDEPASVLLERIAASRPVKPKRRRKARA